MRCIKRNIGHLCHDEPRAIKKEKITVEEEAKPQEVSEMIDSNAMIPTTSSDGKSLFNDWSSLGNQSILSQTVAYNQNPVFYSEHAGSEFSSLNDFLSMIDDPNSTSNLIGTSNFGNLINNNEILSPETSREGSSERRPDNEPSTGRTPSVSETAKDKFFFNCCRSI